MERVLVIISSITNAGRGRKHSTRASKYLLWRQHSRQLNYLLGCAPVGGKQQRERQPRSRLSISLKPRRGRGVRSLARAAALRSALPAARNLPAAARYSLFAPDVL